MHFRANYDGPIYKCQNYTCVMLNSLFVFMWIIEYKQPRLGDELLLKRNFVAIDFLELFFHNQGPTCA